MYFTQPSSGCPGTSPLRFRRVAEMSAMSDSAMLVADAGHVPLVRPKHERLLPLLTLPTHRVPHLPPLLIPCSLYHFPVHASIPSTSGSACADSKPTPLPDITQMPYSPPLTPSPLLRPPGVGQRGMSGYRNRWIGVSTHTRRELERVVVYFAGLNVKYIQTGIGICIKTTITLYHLQWDMAPRQRTISNY